MHELAMRRLRDEFGLEPVEYPTTRRLGACARDRAADLMAAFADSEIRAVLATIGGDDQLTVLPFLDPAVVIADPKPFMGYSDNTNLLNWLWNLGVVGYHGGSTMVHLGRGGGLHPVSVSSLRAALLTGGDVELHPVEVFSEDELDWGDPASLEQEPPRRPSPGWSWHQPVGVVTAPTWGGNLEILHWNLAANRWIRPVEDYAGCVLLLETPTSARRSCAHWSATTPQPWPCSTSTSATPILSGSCPTVGWSPLTAQLAASSPITDQRLRSDWLPAWIDKRYSRPSTSRYAGTQRRTGTSSRTSA